MSQHKIREYKVPDNREVHIQLTKQWMVDNTKKGDKLIVSTDFDEKGKPFAIIQIKKKRRK